MLFFCCLFCLCGFVVFFLGCVLLVVLLLVLFVLLVQVEDGKCLCIGIILYFYYSYVSNIVGDKVEVVLLIFVGFNLYVYELCVEDIKCIGMFDVVVFNGVGYDDFVECMIVFSEKFGILVIEVNVKVLLLVVIGMVVCGVGKVVNLYIFLFISVLIIQVNIIVCELGKFDLVNVKVYICNVWVYVKCLWVLCVDVLVWLNKVLVVDFCVVIIYGVYDYLLCEFGLEVIVVVELVYGIELSLSQLKKIIDQFKVLDVKVIFFEIDFFFIYVEIIQCEFGVKFYLLLYIFYGDYSVGKYEEEMVCNFDIVVCVIQEFGV